MRRPLQLTLIALSGAALSWALLLAGVGSPVPGGPLSLEAAHAGKRCSGAKRSPKKLKVVRAQHLVVCLVNKRRASRGLRRVVRRKNLNAAAAAHTRQMQARNCFSHTCPEEADLPGRLSRSDYLPCGCSWGASETIAWGRGRSQGSPAAVVRFWMRSSLHRKILLGSGFEHAGVGFRRGSPYSDSRKLGTYTLDLGYKR